MVDNYFKVILSTTDVNGRSTSELLGVYPFDTLDDIGRRTALRLAEDTQRRRPWSRVVVYRRGPFMLPPDVRVVGEVYDVAAARLGEEN